ncbi:MAG: hypothetical protein ILP07_09170 [Treponema sp.]|nr:hypothetical protein [Treponema sp.]
MKHFESLKRTFLLVFLLFFMVKADSQARYIFSTTKELGILEVEQPKNLSIPLEVSYYNDGTATMRCNQIPSSYFHPIARSFSTGFYKGVLWVELAFKDTQVEDGKNFYLDLGSEHIDIAELFIMKDGTWEFYGRTGRSLKKSYMSVPSWRLVIPLDESDLSDGPVHRVRVRMCAYLGAPVSFSLQPARNYNSSNLILATFNFGIIVICFVLIVIIFAIALVFKDSAYLLLGITAFLQFLLMLQIKGLGQVFIWNFIAVIPHAPRLTYFMSFAVLSMTAVSFCRIVSETMDMKIFRWEMTGIIGTNAIASLLVLVAYSPSLAFGIYSVAVIVMSLGLFVMWFRGRKRPHSDMFYVTYWWIPILILFIYIAISNLLRFSVAIPKETIVLNRDYFLYDFMLLAMCIPAVRMIIEKTRRKLDVQRREIDNCRKSLFALREERGLFDSVTEQLLKLSNTITSALRLPQMKSHVESVQKIQGIVERSAVQTNDYLTALASLESGKPLEVNRILLKEFYLSCVETSRLIASRKMVEIDFKTDVEDGTIILANQSLIELVFTNSLYTTIRYARPNSSLNLRLEKSGNTVTVIMDCATDPSVHDIIHKRTSEEDFTEQEENETNGLDFRLVRKVLELYEGRLTQSEFRDGFVFRISFKEENQIAQSADLPALTSKFESEYNKKLTDSDMEPAITDDMFSVGGRPPVILLAEENIMVMKFMEGLLHGHCVLYTMSSGADAWNFLQSNGHKPDIIICNYSLPVISGMELFRKCSDVISLQDIPFILMLPLSEASKQNEFIRRGAAACLIPPFTKDELYRTIYTIYSLSKMIQRNVFSIVNKALYGNEGASDDADTRTETQERRTVEPGQKLTSGSSDISLTDSQKTLFDEHELSARERQIAMLISQGLSDKEIADNLCISPGTVVTHKKNVFKKLDVHSRVQLMAKIR